jgi:hypothetical protein
VHEPDFSYTQNLIGLFPIKMPVFKISIKQLTEDKPNFALIFTNPNPIHILVVDEASQIATKNYLTVIDYFNRTLKPVIFIGDPQQAVECQDE